MMLGKPWLQWEPGMMTVWSYYDGSGYQDLRYVVFRVEGDDVWLHNTDPVNSQNGDPNDRFCTGPGDLFRGPDLTHVGTLALLEERLRKRRGEPDGAGPYWQHGYWYWLWDPTAGATLSDRLALGALRQYARTRAELVRKVIEVTE